MFHQQKNQFHIRPFRSGVQYSCKLARRRYFGGGNEKKGFIRVDLYYVFNETC
jgi:hypothetical protein